MPSDVECAFCGRVGIRAHHVACDDCQLTHSVCPTCADDLASTPTEGYRLVA